MSQKYVEAVIGRLATDETFRRRFHDDRAAVIAELAAQGMRLTAVERSALRDLDAAACDRFAERLDSRIQKMSLRENS